MDLFCGGGAVALEALSRGAESAVAADRDAEALAVARSNASLLGAEAFTAVRAVLPQALARPRWQVERFHLIFADPPYGFADWEKLLAHLSPLLEPAGEVALEHGRDPEPPARTSNLVRTRDRAYGSSRLSFYRLGDGSRRP